MNFDDNYSLLRAHLAPKYLEDPNIDAVVRTLCVLLAANSEDLSRRIQKLEDELKTKGAK
jgi:hypothetical protein